MWWDDGSESNVYVTDIGSTLDTHFKLTGQATISPGWSAGYVLHLEAGTSEVRLVNQFSDEGGSAMIVLQSFWFIKSDQLGKVSVGRQSQASDNTAILVDGSGSLVPANWVTFTGDGFYLRHKNGGLVPAGGLGDGAARWFDLQYCNSEDVGIGGDCMGTTMSSVRYDSPTFGGFSVSATWGEDDFWDVAARYAGEFGGFKVAAAAAYSEITDENELALNGVLPNKDVQYFQVGGYIEHVATGVFVYGAWGHEETDHLFNGFAIPDGDVWYVKAGLRERWTPLGHTVLYGFYGKNDDKFNPNMIDDGVTGSEMTNWGFGAVQEIDAAAMSLWLHYQRNEGEVDCAFASAVCLAPTTEFEEWDSVKAGALINF
jgi:hypothetical protein